MMGHLMLLMPECKPDTGRLSPLGDPYCLAGDGALPNSGWSGHALWVRARFRPRAQLAEGVGRVLLTV